jgi:eukaryotic-like serine/threonine-protein kinase
VKDLGERQPPTIAGYVLHTPLGRGAYGEVWLGENRTTKRQVAVKFLHSRATLDWWLLDGEIEKLAFLAADRRVVQLLDVGRDADPPFFVMEYISRGSLARYLERTGPLPLEQAACWRPAPGEACWCPSRAAGGPAMAAGPVEGLAAATC